MFSSERQAHFIRWFFFIGWAILILAMFWDPITPQFTQPSAIDSPFHLNPAVYLDSTRCTKIHDACVQEQPFSLAPLLWWAIIVPAAILLLLTLGHEFWRRICPLSFFSQLPRALGIQRTRRVFDPVTQTAQLEVAEVGKWLEQNHLYVQFGLFVLGLGIRLLFVNGHRMALGAFLIATLLCALVVGFLYSGKAWCQYFCPMSPVQLVFTGPRSLLGTQAHLQPKGSITQSMCRTEQDQSNCVACKKPTCIDVDSEKNYWAELYKPGRSLVQYGYLGMVWGFYGYFFLYAGNWQYYFSGKWTHEEDLLEKVFDSGFYLNGVAIPIPKIVAVFLTFAVCTAVTWWLGLWLERRYRSDCRRRNKPISKEQARHVIFTLYTLVAFWSFFIFGFRSTLNRFAIEYTGVFNAIVMVVGFLWTIRTIKRTHGAYDRERLSVSLRRQLHHLNLPDSLLEGRAIEELNPEEVHLIIRCSRQSRLQAYFGVVKDLLEQSTVEVAESLEFCRSLRKSLELSDSDHAQTISQLAIFKPELLAPRVSTPAGVAPTPATMVMTKKFKQQSTPNTTAIPARKSNESPRKSTVLFRRNRF